MARPPIVCFALLLLAAAAPAQGAARKIRSADLATTTATSLDLYRQGETCLALGNYARAEEYFRAALEREGKGPTLDGATRRKLTVYVALAHQNSAEPARAAALLRAALGKDPRYPLYHYFLAVALAFEHLQRTEAEAGAAAAARPEPERPGAAADRAGKKKTTGSPAPATAAPPPTAPDEIFESLRRAYLLRENLNPGEKIPNPRIDVFLGPLRHDPRFLAVLAEAGPAAEPDLAADLDELAKAGEDAGPDLQQAVIEELEAQPQVAADLLMRRLMAGDLNEKQRAATIWALGRTGDPRAAESLAHLMFQPEMLPFKGVVLEALSRIGGPVAGGALLQELREARDEGERFQVLTLLANMQFEPALPLMMDLLGLDTEQAANQMAYCFGKMGSPAVPALLNKIQDPNKTARINALNMILWLCPSRAMIPLQKQYMRESDPEVRLAILGALNQLMRPDQFEMLLKAGLAREPDREAQSVMSERLAGLDERKTLFAKFKAEKLNDRLAYAAAYEALFKSYGRAAGTLEALARTSTALDEPELERLRARVLDRQSEECFADYMKINRIIAFNRMIEVDKPGNVSVQRVDTLKNPAETPLPKVPGLALPGLRNK